MEPRFQITQLPNQNLAVCVVGDDHPGTALKLRLAQFKAGQVVNIGGKAVEIDGITMRPAKGYCNAYTEWHIHYFVHHVDDPRREECYSETDLLMFNPQPERMALLALCLGLLYTPVYQV